MSYNHQGNLTSFLYQEEGLKGLSLCEAEASPYPKVSFS